MYDYVRQCVCASVCVCVLPGKGDVKTAVTTLSKAWESASALGPQHRGHQNLLQAYKVALMKANDRMAMIRLATEAMDRGFSQEMLMAAP